MNVIMPSDTEKITLPSGRLKDLNKERFCQLYATKEQFFCNGVDSYAEVYNIDLEDPKGRSKARKESKKLLNSPDILKRIDQLIESSGLNDSFVDKQHEKLITQDSDKSVKLGAIKLYKEERGKLTKKIDLTSKGEQVTSMAELLTLVQSGGKER